MTARRTKRFAGGANGVAFTTWGDDAGDVRNGVWIVDWGSTQHVTADRSQFTSYRELVRDEKIMEFVGDRRGSTSGAGGENRADREDNVVRMEAVKRGGLWENETVEKQRAFLARGPVKENRECATAKRSVRAESVVQKTVKVVEVDLDEAAATRMGASKERGELLWGRTRGRAQIQKWSKKGRKLKWREGDAHGPATDCGHVARTISKKGQSGPIVETMREIAEKSEEIGKGKESPKTAVESKPAGVERATEKPIVSPKSWKDIWRECDWSPSSGIGQMWEQQRKAWEPKSRSTEWRKRRRKRATMARVEACG
ncbi:hypothetical protein KFL_012160010 [Klebsormidium nitens]|uniref:Uncharacterized protein n=1 Tax=Klebsormidium nitens TaxID=105231 RepID=A0A1Y1IQG0_KLENI|nr:hypothetical protein KFL_012160010 [Klebsormidium nitens]|eukprot:GAQ92944.1 hypothetical protein KFL_012160010 [Klebsormidium nitens]